MFCWTLFIFQRNWYIFICLKLQICYDFCPLWLLIYCPKDPCQFLKHCPHPKNSPKKSLPIQSAKNQYKKLLKLFFLVKCYNAKLHLQTSTDPVSVNVACLEIWKWNFASCIYYISSPESFYQRILVICYKSYGLFRWPKNQFCCTSMTEFNFKRCHVCT